MKKIVFILACALFSISSIAQSKQTQQDVFQTTFNQLKTLVQSKAYTFDAAFVYSNKNREPLQNNTNTLVVNGNLVTSVIVGLSFENKNIESTGTIQNYKTEFNADKHTINISFNVGNASYYLDVKPNGNTFLTAKSGGTTITQIGKLK